MYCSILPGIPFYDQNALLDNQRTRTRKCPRLSTQGVPFVDGWCNGGAFVHRRAVFCGRRRRIAPACPHRGCRLWTDDAMEGLLSTGGRYFVDADGELRPPVHGKGAICGRPVTRREFCPQAGGILWMWTKECPRLSTERVPFVDGRCPKGLLTKQPWIVLGTILFRVVLCRWRVCCL